MISKPTSERSRPKCSVMVSPMPSLALALDPGRRAVAVEHHRRLVVVGLRRRQHRARAIVDADGSAFANARFLRRLHRMRHCRDDRPSAPAAERGWRPRAAGRASSADAANARQGKRRSAPEYLRNTRSSDRRAASGSPGPLRHRRNGCQFSVRERLATFALPSDCRGARNSVLGYGFWPPRDTGTAFQFVRRTTMNKHATVQDLAAETRDLLSHCGVAEAVFTAKQGMSRPLADQRPDHRDDRRGRRQGCRPPRSAAPMPPSSNGGMCRRRSAASWCACSATSCAEPRPSSAGWSRSRPARSPPKGSAKCRR